VYSQLKVRDAAVVLPTLRLRPADALNAVVRIATLSNHEFTKYKQVKANNRLQTLYVVHPSQAPTDQAVAQNAQVCCAVPALAW
jgi:hypothetical protein